MIRVVFESVADRFRRSTAAVRLIPVREEGAGGGAGSDAAAGDWEVIEVTEHGYHHVLFLPGEEDDLRDEAFVIAERAAVVDPVDWR